MASPQSGALGPDMDGEEEYRELSAFLGSQRMQYDELRHVYDEKKRVLQDLKRECKHLQNLSSHNDGQKVTFQAQVQSLDSRIVDDPFAKQTAILQERRLQQRQGVLEIDHVQPHPPKDEKKNGSVSKKRRKSKIK